MNQEKIEKFFQVAIDKTKSGVLVWHRIYGSSEREYVVNHFMMPLDLQRSFVSLYGKGKIFLLSRAFTDDIVCYVLPDKDLSCQEFGEDNDPLLLRLYNIVYSLFPSMESFIDSFISDS